MRKSCGQSNGAHTSIVHYQHCPSILTKEVQRQRRRMGSYDGKSGYGAGIASSVYWNQSYSSDEGNFVGLARQHGKSRARQYLGYYMRSKVVDA